MSARKTKIAETIALTFAGWAWFRTLTRAIFGETIRQLVDEQTNKILVEVFQHHRREFQALDERISERFGLCQELLAQNVAKLRREQTERAHSFEEALAALSNRLGIAREAGR